MKNNNWEKLERIEQLAQGNIVNRFLNDPIRYIKAVGYWRVVYPIKKKGRFASATTFFGKKMNLVLPSATEIYLFGAKTHDSEIRLTRYLMKQLSEGDTCCDVGAHFGYFTLLSSQLVGPSGKVVSFEASQSTFAILNSNTSAFGNITIEHKAASDQSGTVTFHEFPALFSEYNSMVMPSANQSAWLKNNPPSRIEVEAVALDSYFSKNNILPKIIKIDVEGAEPQVLNGLSETMANHAPTLVMEYLTEGSQNNAHRTAIEQTSQLGYRPYLITESGDIALCNDIEQSMAERGLTSDNIVLKKS